MTNIYIYIYIYLKAPCVFVSVCGVCVCPSVCMRVSVCVRVSQELSKPPTPGVATPSPKQRRLAEQVCAHVTTRHFCRRSAHEVISASFVFFFEI